MAALHTWAPNPPETELHAEDLGGQLAIFEPDQPDTTYLDGPIDHGPLRTCSECGRERPITEFCRRTLAADGINYRCNTCHRGRTRQARGVVKEHARLEPTPDDRCAICGGKGDPRGLYLDHDHTTGRFRGWLCHGCNTGIGGLQDDPELLAAAITYLGGRP